MTNCKRYKVAAIDLGTVSSRLVLAQVEDGAIVESSKHTEITDLGEGVDATGRFCEAAVGRVLAACRMFVDEARAFGATCICTTCTSAARDASNAALLLDGLRELGLDPQVIPGEVEARLTFFGVAHDFAGERIIVTDSGGGSTELATGVYAPERGIFALEGTRSLDIGCRRVTERFFSALPPTGSELAAAGAWANEQFAGYFKSLPVDFERAERLVAVGGTVTTLVALVHELEPYDSSFVHLRELSLDQVSAAIERMSSLDVAGIAALPGVQPKRAGVILAGAVVIRELMRAGGYDALTVSENSLLAGMAATINEVLDGATPTIAWTPSLSVL
ncbi:Ppx/GppA phosphatase family protein [Collinsella sp. LCP19S3_D5]|uniref:Ppx/GppA phosphatase family protein n=1 Tax=Collinsella sp. LCP19S3_D5 TaxID=3438764 RepID=UPI003F8DDFEF